MINCKECITYAICKHKQHINCDVLWKIFWDSDDSESHMDLFDKLESILPEATSIERAGFGIVVNKQNPHYSFKDK